MGDRLGRVHDIMVGVFIWLVVPALTAVAYMLLAFPARSLMAWLGMAVPYWVALAVLLAVVSVIIITVSALAIRYDSTY